MLHGLYAAADKKKKHGLVPGAQLCVLLIVFEASRRVDFESSAPARLSRASYGCANRASLGVVRHWSSQKCGKYSRRFHAKPTVHEGLRCYIAVRVAAYETIAGDLNEFVDTVHTDTTEAVIDPIATAAKGLADGEQVRRKLFTYYTRIVN